MTSPAPLPFHRRLLAATTVAALAIGPALPARANGQLGSMVRAFCLSAFEAEMSRAGKTPPPGMATYACDCVAERITGGSTVAAAKASCRDATARRYPI